MPLLGRELGQWVLGRWEQWAQLLGLLVQLHGQQSAQLWQLGQLAHLLGQLPHWSSQQGLAHKGSQQHSQLGQMGVHGQQSAPSWQPKQLVHPIG